jgi:hypothetical protein
MMMELVDESSDERRINAVDDCDSKRLLLKKNLSWTNTNCSSIVKLNSLKTSRSNPHVLDAVASNVSKLKLATSQLLPSRFQTQSNFSADDEVARSRLAPLAKAISASTLTAATIATPTSIQLTIRPKSELNFYSRAILEHCKVNSQLTRTEINKCLPFAETPNSKKKPTKNAFVQ